MRTLEYLESDLGTAAFLVARGIRLLGIVEVSPNHYAFRFDDGDGKATSVALEYFQGGTAVGKSLVAAVRDLKTLIYNTKGNTNGNRNHQTRR